MNKNSTLPIVNIAYYKFVKINNVDALQETLQTLCDQLNLKGTIILANEGINSCLAGDEKSLEDYISFMRNDTRFADIDFKRSPSTAQPFRRMLVKVKPEIVTMGQENIEPEVFTGKYVEALELKEWLDNGEDLILVDTRNDYEVKLGTFKGAIDPNIQSFRTFPDWAKTHLSGKKNAKIVTFCTGGIRCEKATAYMRQEGFDEVYQLQGGILKYFEETQKTKGDNHFEGDCFVFDYRVAIDKELNKTAHTICYACWQPLVPEDLKHPLYVHEKQCHHCAHIQAERVATRQLRGAQKYEASLAKLKERTIEIKKTIQLQKKNATELGETL